MCTSSNINFSSNTGNTIISTVNTNLDGTGNIADLITGASDGTIIRNIKIKAMQSTSIGMIRLFLYDPSSGIYYLYTEIPVPETIQTGVVRSFSTNYSDGLCIPAGFKIGVSTEVAESFAINAEGANWTNCQCQ